MAGKVAKTVAAVAANSAPPGKGASKKNLAKALATKFAKKPGPQHETLIMKAMLNRAPKTAYKHLPYPDHVIHKQKEILRTRYMTEVIEAKAEERAQVPKPTIIKDDEEPKLTQLSDTVRVYNPMGTSKYPVRPIVFLNGLTTKHTAFYTILREMNYPYGAAFIDIDHMGKHRSLQDKIKVYNEALKTLRIKTPAWVVGLDLGALTAFAAAKQDMRSVPGITLLNSSVHQVEKTLKEQFMSEEPLVWDCEFANFTLNTRSAKIRSLLKNPNTLEDIHPEFQIAWHAALERHKTLITEQMFNPVDARLLQRDVNAAHKRLATKNPEALITKFASEWRKMFHTPEDMFELRHPLNLISSNFGIPRANELHPKSKFIGAVNLYYHHHTQHVQSSELLPTFNVYETLCNLASAKKIMSTVEASLSPYDVHRNIQETFEWLRQPTHKRSAVGERLWSIHNQPHLNAIAREEEEKENDEDEEDTENETDKTNTDSDQEGTAGESEKKASEQV
eukprot:CAMPEP_0117440492 /NCGR_PEP_ID=MMETSP0759-20121206/3126_1 /TAXON_ID=63605 /ORGANISM="Percolomonas cosmopolitus, Strain WS" /LENGTH=505 /DNA_ID=CAMNT_0005232275 /DNA_START=142 /DNA_END=1659 /DNA_ORIENTATION=+